MIQNADQFDGVHPRPIAKEDLIPAARLWHEAWHEAHAAHLPMAIVEQRTFSSFQARLSKMLPLTYVIGPLGLPLGLCAIAKDELDQIYVSPEGRGIAAASALLRNGEARLSQDGCTRAHLFCLPQNSLAISFYLKNGWASTGSEDVVLPALTTPVSVVRFEKDLSS